MDGQTACDKCGLKAVRYELERRGIVMRFCDTCYWGALEAEETPASFKAEGEHVKSSAQSG